MKILRLAWSNYQDTASLEQEKRYLERHGHEYRRPEVSGAEPAVLSSQDVVLINSQFQVDGSFLERFSGGLIVTASNGYDHVDLTECSRRGIPVARTPEARAGAVVEHTFAFITALLRDVHRSGMELKLSGDWSRSGAFEAIHKVSTTSLGVLGYGVIGRKVVDRALDLGFESVFVCDPLSESLRRDDDRVHLVEFGALLDNAELLTLHAPLNEFTEGLIDRAVLDRLGEEAYLVNTARGSIVDLDDLFRALESGDLAGAALDVFPEEPPSQSVTDVPGLLATPHSGGFHPDLLDDLRREIGEVIESYESGGSLKNSLTPYSSEEESRLSNQWLSRGRSDR